MIIDFITKDGQTIRLMDGMETPMKFFIPSDYLKMITQPLNIALQKSFPAFFKT